MRLPYKLLLAAPALFFLYFYGLTRVGMIGPDEPRYAAIGREMARSGDWVTPRLWGEVWFEKPALLYWLVAAGNVAGFGADLAPRAPVAAVSLLFLLFFFFQMRREFGERAAWFATGILATSAGWLAFSHVGVTDLPLAACFSAAILLALRWVRCGGRRGLAFAGVFLGFAVLAKGLVPLVLALPLVWVGRRRWPDLLILGGACLAVAAPWYLLCWVQNGEVFVHEFFWRHHFGRFFSTELQHVQPWWFYFPVVLGFLFPWTPLLWGLRGVDWRDQRVQLLLFTLVFGFVFFSVSTNKLPGYVLPLIPCVAALLGIQFAAFRMNRWLIPASAALLCLTPVVAATLPEALALGLSRADIAGYSSPMTLVLLACAAACAWLVSRGRTHTAFGITVALAALAILHLKWDMYPRLDRTASARTLWSADTQCIDNVHRAIRYGLNYYAGRELPDCTSGRNKSGF